MIRNHQFDVEKFKSVVLYVCSKCARERLGAVKLHKTLYFSDMFYYAQSGTPLTGAVYRKRPLGPTCDALLPILRDMQKDGVIEIGEVDYFGFKKKEYIAKKNPELDRFRPEELHLMDEVIDFVCNNNSAKTISEFSHNKAWEQAEFGDVLTYNSVFKLFPTQVSIEALDWAKSEVVNIEAMRTSKPSVESEDFAAFRKRLHSANRT